MNAMQFINNLARQGRHFFTIADAIKKLGKSKSTTIAALGRLQQQGFLASPSRGFYLIIPPHYQIYGCLPAEQFVPDLMKYFHLPYYVGLLSAAQYYGAAHQKPQQFQVITKKYLRPSTCGKIFTVFVRNEKVSKVPVRQFNTPTGYLNVSTPEATAIDLIRYPYRSGGINNIATVLIELAESIDSSRLINCIKQIEPEVVTLQRLGYLFEVIEEHEFATSVGNILESHQLRTRPLVSGMSTKNMPRNKHWELYINFSVEPDL